LGDILFDKMGLKGGRKGKSGVWSTDVNELERLTRDGVPIAQMVLEWRQLTKLKTTYTDALQQQINRETGRRPHQLLAVRRADRPPVVDRPEPPEHPDPHRDRPPHPRRLHRGGRQRRARRDYSQIELRLAAHMADVPQLKEAFAAGADIHSMTAQELFGEVNRDTSASAKTINFAILYGISRWGLAQRLAITADEAQAMIDRYFDRFPGVRNYIHENAEQGARDRLHHHPVRPQNPLSPASGPRSSTSARAPERAAINAPDQGTSADIIKRAMARMGPCAARRGPHRRAHADAGHDELVFEVPDGGRGGCQRRASPRHGRRRPTRGEAQRAARHRYRHRHPLGQRALSSAAAPGAAPPDDDIAALARGGRTNVFGFVLRLIARLPFLFIAGQLYGAEALGRFAYAVIVVEFAAQLATLGLKRGLAQQLRASDQPHVCTVWDAMLAALIASALASVLLMLVPQAMFPNSERHGADFLLPLVIFGIAGADVALAALAYQHNIAATVRARAIVEPWTISIAAGALWFYSPATA
jgi:hypothetical protein